MSVHASQACLLHIDCTDSEDLPKVAYGLLLGVNINDLEQYNDQLLMCVISVVAELPVVKSCHSTA